MSVKFVHDLSDCLDVGQTNERNTRDYHLLGEMILAFQHFHHFSFFFEKKTTEYSIDFNRLFYRVWRGINCSLLETMQEI